MKTIQIDPIKQAIEISNRKRSPLNISNPDKVYEMCNDGICGKCHECLLRRWKATCSELADIVRREFGDYNWRLESYNELKKL